GERSQRAPIRTGGDAYATTGERIGRVGAFALPDDRCSGGEPHARARRREACPLLGFQDKQRTEVKRTGHGPQVSEGALHTSVGNGASNGLVPYFRAVDSEIGGRRETDRRDLCERSLAGVPLRRARRGRGAVRTALRRGRHVRPSRTRAAVVAGGEQGLAVELPARPRSGDPLRAVVLALPGGAWRPGRERQPRVPTRDLESAAAPSPSLAGDPRAASASRDEPGASQRGCRRAPLPGDRE